MRESKRVRVRYRVTNFIIGNNKELSAISDWNRMLADNVACCIISATTPTMYTYCTHHAAFINSLKFSRNVRVQLVVEPH